MASRTAPPRKEENAGRRGGSSGPEGCGRVRDRTSLDERIVAVLGELTPKQQALARVLLEDKMAVAFSSTEELGRRAGVDPATVVRFSRRLGYSGFSDLRRAVRDAVPQFVTTLEKVQRTLDGHEAAGDLVQGVFLRDIENIEATARSNPPELLQRAIQAIANAQRVFALGFGVEAHVADLLVHHLMHVGVAAHRSPESVNDAAIDIASVTPGDVVISVGVWRYLRNLRDLTRAAQALGATTIGLTDSPASALAPEIDILLVGSTEAAELSHSLTALGTLANALATGVALGAPERSVHTLAKVDDLYTQLGILMD